MKFNFKEPNPGVWFFFDDKNHKEGRICLRVANSKVLREIYKKTRKKSYQTVAQKNNPRLTSVHEILEIDEEKENKLLWDYCIVDWENLQDDDGLDVKCTTEAKTTLMDENPNFINFISEKQEIINSTIRERKGNEEKNSSSTPRDILEK